MSCTTSSRGSFIARIRGSFLRRPGPKSNPEDNNQHAAAHQIDGQDRRGRRNVRPPPVNHSEDEDADESSNGGDSERREQYRGPPTATKSLQRPADEVSVDSRTAAIDEHLDEDVEDFSSSETASAIDENTDYSATNSESESESDEEAGPEEKKLRKQQRKHDRELERRKFKEEKRRQKIEKRKLKMVEKQRRRDQREDLKKRKVMEREAERKRQEEDRDTRDLLRLEKQITKIRKKENKLVLQKHREQQKRLEKLEKQNLIRERIRARRAPDEAAPVIVTDMEGTTVAVEQESEERSSGHTATSRSHSHDAPLEECDIRVIANDKHEQHQFDSDDGHEPEKAKEEIPGTSKEESAICWLPSTREIRVTVEEASANVSVVSHQRHPYDMSLAADRHQQTTSLRDLRSVRSHAGEIRHEKAPQEAVRRERSASVRRMASSAKAAPLATPSQLLKGLVAFDELENALLELNRQVEELRTLAQR